MVSGNPPKPKIKGQPLQRTAKQQAAIERAAEKRAEAEDLARQQSEADAVAATQAQLANLVIAGFSFEQIGASIGASPAEVERMLNESSARYVRTQSSLRIWTRNYLSGQYAKMLEVDMPIATDPNRADMLEHQDRAIRILSQLAKLHGAEAPSQSEVKVETAPEAIEKMVERLSRERGTGFDLEVFDLDDDDIVEINEAAASAPAQSLAALERASAEVEQILDEDEHTDEMWEGA